jgi:DNA-binding MarR family transcriptional regulator
MRTRAATPPTPSGALDEVERASRVFFAVTVQAMDRLDSAISPAGLRALLVLADDPDITLSELARRVPLSQSAASRMVDRLVNADLLTRSVPAGDRRRIQLTLTSGGKALVRELIRHRREAIDNVAATMSRTDLDALRRGLQAFDASAGRHTTPPS